MARETDIVVQAPQGTFEDFTRLRNTYEGGIGNAYTKRRLTIFSLEEAQGKTPTWYSVHLDVDQSDGERVVCSFGITNEDRIWHIVAERTVPEPIEELPEGWEWDGHEYEPLSTVSVEQILEEIKLAERSQKRLKAA